MKINKKQLKKIIQEELRGVLAEITARPDITGGYIDDDDWAEAQEQHLATIPSEDAELYALAHNEYIAGRKARGMPVKKVQVQAEPLAPWLEP